METIRAKNFSEFASMVADAVADGKNVRIAATAADGVYEATTYESGEFDG